jgi:hypothetical protein
MCAPTAQSIGNDRALVQIAWSYDSHIAFIYGARASLAAALAKGGYSAGCALQLTKSSRQKFFATCEVAHRHWSCPRSIMRSVEVAESREIAMSMTAYFPIAETQAGARRSRSMWRRFFDAMIEAQQRKAEEEADRYLRRYPPHTRDALTYRMMGS